MESVDFPTCLPLLRESARSEVPLPGMGIEIDQLHYTVYTGAESHLLEKIVQRAGFYRIHQDRRFLHRSSLLVGDQLYPSSEARGFISVNKGSILQLSHPPSAHLSIPYRSGFRYAPSPAMANPPPETVISTTLGVMLGLQFRGIPALWVAQENKVPRYVVYILPPDPGVGLERRV